MRPRRCAALLSLLLVAWIAPAPAPAVAFGTIDSGGQHREHERITRAALACTNGESACLEPGTSFIRETGRSIFSFRSFLTTSP